MAFHRADWLSIASVGVSIFAILYGQHTAKRQREIDARLVRNTRWERLHSIFEIAAQACRPVFSLAESLKMAPWNDGKIILREDLRGLCKDAVNAPSYLVDITIAELPGPDAVAAFIELKTQLQTVAELANGQFTSGLPNTCAREIGIISVDVRSTLEQLRASIIDASK